MSACFSREQFLRRDPEFTIQFKRADLLKQRVITPFILILVFVFLVLKLSPQAFCILTGLIMLVGAWEWSALMGVSRLPHAFFYPIFIIFVLLGSLFLPIKGILFAAVAWWLIAAVLVARYPNASDFGKGVALRGIMGMLTLIPCWVAINFIRNMPSGTYVLLFLFVLIWGADSGAYFVGKKWGKSKLAAEVSPGKTWQGLGGALIVTIIIAIAVLQGFKLSYDAWPAVVLLSLVTVLFSVEGDLVESMLKRKVNLKDSGKLLPGHGGLLDRIDSLTAAAPVFAIGSMLIIKTFF